LQTSTLETGAAARGGTEKKQEANLRESPRRGAARAVWNMDGDGSQRSGRVALAFD